jgi:hypothetical protein
LIDSFLLHHHKVSFGNLLFRTHTYSGRYVSPSLSQKAKVKRKLVSLVTKSLSRAQLLFYSTINRLLTNQNAMRDSSNTNQQAALVAAIRLNNEGANLLEQDDFRSACKTFSTALKVVRGQYAPDSSSVLLLPTTNNYSSTSTFRHHKTGEGCRFTKRRASRKPKYSESQSGLSSQQHPRQQEKATPDFVFRIPMRLVQRQDGEAKDQCSIFSVSSAILFNLGLTQFLMAIECSDQRSQHRLTVALQLFEMVRALLEATKNEENNELLSSGGDSFPFLHLLGLVNNAAQIHKLLNQNERADRLLEHLLTSLMLVVVDKDEEDARGALEVFFAATSHLVLQKACAEAA